MFIEGDEEKPQEIQKKYNEYKELIKSMIKVNTLLIDYKNQLRAIIE